MRPRRIRSDSRTVTKSVALLGSTGKMAYGDLVCAPSVPPASIRYAVWLYIRPPISPLVESKGADPGRSLSGAAPRACHRRHVAGRTIGRVLFPAHRSDRAFQHATNPYRLRTQMEFVGAQVQRALRLPSTGFAAADSRATLGNDSAPSRVQDPRYPARLTTHKRRCADGSVEHAA